MTENLMISMNIVMTTGQRVFQLHHHCSMSNRLTQQPATAHS